MRIAAFNSLTVLFDFNFTPGFSKLNGKGSDEYVYKKRATAARNNGSRKKAIPATR